jgi:hypothetical protein
VTLKEFKTVKEIARQCRVDRHKVRHWIESGQLVAHNLATSTSTRPIWRIAAEDLAAFLDSRASKPVAKPSARKKAASGAVKEFV